MSGPASQPGARGEGGDASPSLLAIVTALPEELAPFRRRASNRRSARVLSARYFLGRLAGRPVVMACTGAGRGRAEQGARALLDAFSVRGLVGAGVAGGLSPGLGVGEILVGDPVRDGSAAVRAPDASWVERALRSQGAPRRATLVTVDRLLWSAQGKASLWGTCSSAQPAAVDLESAAWARVAAERGIPYLILRSVLDRAEEDLSEFLARCQDPDGGLSRARVVRHALLRPRLVPGLLALRARTRSGGERLADFVEGLLREEAARGSSGHGRAEMGDNTPSRAKAVTS
jgi:adenosylhomocysteine nucleosidase